MSFQDKVVLVTGASSGIGAATAIAFTSSGARVAMVGRNQDKLKKVAEQCQQRGSKPLVIVADVARSEDRERIMADTLAHFKRLDVLVNNAGMYKQVSILAPEAMQVHQLTMATNLQSAVHLTHLAAPQLILTKGNIISVSSIGSKSISADESFSFIVTQAGLDHFTRAVALELAPKGVRVNTVNPGPVRTNFLETQNVPVEQWNATFEEIGQQTPLQRMGEPEEIAELILFLASDKARSITGSAIVSDNGMLLKGGPMKL